MRQRAPGLVVVASSAARAHRLCALEPVAARRAVAVAPGPQLEPLVRLLDPPAIIVDAADGDALACVAAVRGAGCRGVVIGAAPSLTNAIRRASLAAGLDAVVSDADVDTVLPGSESHPHARTRVARAAPPTLRLGGVEVDLATGTVVRDGRVSRLPARERTLLAALYRRRGAVVRRSTLLREVWGDPAPSSRVVDRHVARLRQRLEREPDAPEHIVTVFREGYRLAP